MNIDGVLTQPHRGGSGGFLFLVIKLSPEKKTQLPRGVGRDMDSEGAPPLWDCVSGADPDPGLRMQLSIL